MDKKELGNDGETAVCKYLERKGYKIISRNFCIRGGEIDIIAQNDEFIVFVEVKTRHENSMTSGTDAITKTKQKLIIKTAQAFLNKSPSDLQPRFDIAEVISYNSIPKKIRFIENAFDTSGYYI